MANTTTNYGLTKPLETDFYDIKVFNANLDKIDTEIKNANDKAANGSAKSIRIEHTIAASAWSNSNYVFSDSRIKNDTEQIIEFAPRTGATTELITAVQMANINAVSQSAGKLTVKAYGEVPTVDIPCVFVLRGDL